MSESVTKADLAELKYELIKWTSILAVTQVIVGALWLVALSRYVTQH